MMLVHEFFLCDDSDLPKDTDDMIDEWFQLKESQNNIIYISDDIVLKHHEKFFKGFHAYWNKLDDKTFEGLDYYGITIIPTSEIRAFIESMKYIPDRNIKRLIKMCKNAIMTKKCIVHFGV